MRRMIQVENEVPQELTFRLAKTQGELEAAYRILHDSYVDMKYMSPDPTGMRLVKYFALPTTSTLIALWKGEVVGTMSIIRQSPFGLPMDKNFDLKAYYNKGWQIAEVSSLAIKKEFRQGRGKVFFPLCKFFYDYARFYMNLDAVVIAVNPSWKDFYEGLLTFKPLPEAVVNTYGFANGAPATGLIMPLKQSEKDFWRRYSGLPRKNNLFEYFVPKGLSNAEFPNRWINKSLDPVMTPEMLNYFFVQKSQVLNSLDPIEVKFLRNLYPHARFQKLWDASLSKIGPVQTRGPRFVVALAGQLNQRPIEIINVSRNGLLIRANEKSLKSGSVLIHAGEEIMGPFAARLAWTDPIMGTAGLEMEPASLGWTQLIDRLENELNFPEKKIA